MVIPHFADSIYSIYGTLERFRGTFYVGVQRSAKFDR